MAAFLDLVNHSASVRDTTVYCFVTRVTAMSEPRLGMKVIRALSREMALGHILRKVSRLLREKAAAQIELRRCDHFGPGARVAGRVRVENRGSIVIGSGFRVDASYCAVELVSETGGAIEIGKSVFLNFGTMLYARQLVRIGDRSKVGQYSILADCEVPEAQGAFWEKPKPIVIGKDVWIAGRVTVLPGSTIGNGSVITAGSIVSGEIRPVCLRAACPRACCVRSTATHRGQMWPASAPAGSAAAAEARAAGHRKSTQPPNPPAARHEAAQVEGRELPDVDADRLRLTGRVSGAAGLAE